MSRVTLCPPKIDLYDDLRLRTIRGTPSTSSDVLIALCTMKKTHLRVNQIRPMFSYVQPAQRSLQRPYRFISVLSTTLRRLPCPFTDFIVRTGSSSPRLTKSSCTRLRTDCLVSADPGRATTGSKYVHQATTRPVLSCHLTSKSVENCVCYSFFCLEHMLGSGRLKALPYLGASFRIWECVLVTRRSGCFSHPLSQEVSLVTQGGHGDKSVHLYPSNKAFHRSPFPLLR